MATTVPLSSFLPYVLPHTPGAPDFVAEKYVRLAAIEFCERTRCWRRIATVDVADYSSEALVAPEYAAIHEIEYATFKSDLFAPIALAPTQFSDLQGELLANPHWSVDGSWDINTPINPADKIDRNAPPQYITQVNPNTVTIYPFMPGRIEISLFLKPRMGQAFIPGTSSQPMIDAFNVAPDFLLTQWGMTIASGALSKMLIEPGKSWSNPGLGGFHLQRFNEGCDSHFSSNMRGQQRAPRRSRFSFM
jgi:hypothetical protein